MTTVYFGHGSTWPPRSIPLRAHVVDREAYEFHVTGLQGWNSPHAHLIIEDWPVAKKNALGLHMRRFHE